MKRIFCALLCIFIVSSLNANNGNSKNRIPHLQKTWDFKTEAEKKSALELICPIHVQEYLEKLCKEMYTGEITLSIKNYTIKKLPRGKYFASRFSKFLSIQTIARVLIEKKDQQEIKRYFNTHIPHKHKKIEDFTDPLELFFSYHK